MRLRALILLLASSCVAQLILPVNRQQVFEAPSRERRPRIAIIGAGASGSFAAYWLSFLGRQNATLAVDVTLFEARDSVGGRSTTIEIPGFENQLPLELGASIFVQANKNLWKAARVFNLTLQEGSGGGTIEQGFAIHNGEKFVFEERTGSSYYWNIAKLLWVYGRAPLKVQSLVNAAVKTFISIYSPDFQAKGPFRTVPEFADELEFSSLYQQSIESYFGNNGVYARFTDDLVGAAVRVNYGQTPAHIHAVDGLVSLAAAGASSVVGGNKLIFERFVAESDAHVKLHTPVNKIVRLDNERRWLVGNHGVFDAVIIATPFHLSNLEVIGANVRVPKQDYVRLHVTLLVTSAPTTKAGFFVDKPKGQAGQRTVMSTFAEAERGMKRRPRINSVNYLRQVEEGKWAVKIFSEREVNDELLEDLFGLDTVSWLYKQLWDAYPRATPMQSEDFASFVLAPRLYYANAFEPLVSTMETSTVGGANVANLLLQDVFGFRSSKSWAEWDE